MWLPGKKDVLSSVGVLGLAGWAGFGVLVGEVSPKENSLPLAALPTLPGLYCLLWLPVVLYPARLSSLGLSFAFSNCEHLDPLRSGPWALCAQAASGFRSERPLELQAQLDSKTQGPRPQYLAVLPSIQGGGHWAPAPLECYL